MKYILSLDSGTTSTRALIFDKNANIVGCAQQEFRQIYPAAGWVEHDPTDVIGSAVGVIAQAVTRANLSLSDIAALGITNQRETTVVWDAFTGKPVYNAIVWQCRRTAAAAEKLKQDGASQFIYDKTGLIPDAYFSATKVCWILDNVAGARERAERGELLFGTVDTYLMWRLSRGKIFATDYTNASRTMLFNIHTLSWDRELLKLFKIPLCMMPEVMPSCGLYGYTDASVVGARIPVYGVAGDQQAALFGQLCVNKGDVKNTYGTGCFLLMNTGDTAVKSKNGLVTTLGACHRGKPPYVLEGSVFAAGSVVQWLRDELGLISAAAESERLANSVKSADGVYIVPAFTGLGAPHWDSNARGIICGLTRGSGRAHIVRAALESIAYQSADLVMAMERDAHLKVGALQVDGGASANNFLMAFQADVLGIEVRRPQVIESTALGAAYLAGLGCGMWKGVEELQKNAGENQSFMPHITDEERAAAMAGWHDAVKRARLKQ